MQCIIPKYRNVKKCYIYRMVPKVSYVSFNAFSHRNKSLLGRTLLEHRCMIEYFRVFSYYMMINKTKEDVTLICI